MYSWAKVMLSWKILILLNQWGAVRDNAGYQILLLSVKIKRNIASRSDLKIDLQLRKDNLTNTKQKHTEYGSIQWVFWGVFVNNFLWFVMKIAVPLVVNNLDAALVEDPEINTMEEAKEQWTFS